MSEKQFKSHMILLELIYKYEVKRYGIAIANNQYIKRLSELNLATKFATKKIL